ncbi:hypothetical protein GGI20_000793 [Coemansia sp. BCRC 34301]|nr:hypothetical protein GGI20_000793 [Coemansia sp. BCRC 34301]
MSGVSTFGFADNSALTSRGVEHKPLSSLGLESMAGIVMNAKQSEDNVEQLSSRTAASPYPYTKSADSISHSTPGYERPDVQTNLARSSSESERVRATQPAATGVAVANLNGIKGHTAAVLVRERRGERALREPEERSNGHMKSHEGFRAVHSTNMLLDQRANSAGCATHIKGAAESYHDEGMRRSIHRLISATTRFDSVTGGALSLMSDIARLYLMRIGESSRARADLANRTEPNLYDVCHASAVDLGVDWMSLRAWVDDWKAEVGTPQSHRGLGRTSSQLLGIPASSEKRRSDADGSEYLAGPKRRNSWDDIATDSESLIPQRILANEQPNGSTGIGPCNGAAYGCLLSSADAEYDLDAMLSGLNLSCLLLDDTDMVDGLIPPHLPALVPLVESDDGERLLDDAEAPTDKPTDKPDMERPAALGAEASGGGGESMGSIVGEDNGPESELLRLLQISTASLSVLPPSVIKDKPLYGFYRPETKFHESCAPVDAFPDFVVPEEAYVPALESIAQHLVHIDKIKPGHPMFLQGDTTKRNVLGDLEEQWRQARYSQYQDISDDIADMAIQEMDESPMPLRPRRLDSSEDTLVLDPSVTAHKTNEYTMPVASSDTNNEGDGVEHIEVPCTDITLAEDVLDMDMDVDLDMDILNSLPDTRLDGSQHDTDIDEPLFDTSLDMQDFAEPEQPLDEEPPERPESPEPLEPIDLPMSSGLRGSGKDHWALEWLTPAMATRLCQLTADDITPCDSLFLSNPWVNDRNSIDDIARAFVDSEGGGHLHETMPLEGIGPHGHSAPNGSGSALRWTLHHLMHTKGAHAAESLHTGRSSLAGGVSGDGVTQYLSRMFSLIRASAEEEAEQVVSGALRLSKDKDKDASANAAPAQDKLMEQLIAGAEKRVPWAQNKLDIHLIESMIVNRAPQKADIAPQAPQTPSADTPLASMLPSQAASPPPSLPLLPQPQPQPQQPAPEQPPPLAPEQQQQQPQHNDDSVGHCSYAEAVPQIE